MVFTILYNRWAATGVRGERAAWRIVELGCTLGWRNELCENVFCLGISDVGENIGWEYGRNRSVNIHCLFPNGLIGNVTVMADDPVQISCGTKKRGPP